MTDVYVTGGFSDASINLFNQDNTPSGIVLLNSSGGGGPYNAYLAKYDSQGIAKWGAQMGGFAGGGGAYGNGVTLDAVGNAYVTGQFSDPSFNLYNKNNVLSGVVLQNSTGGGGNYNTFLAKYNSEGIAQWGVPMGGINQSNGGNGVTVDLTGNVYVTGYFRDQSFNLYNSGNALSGIVLQNSNDQNGYTNAFLAKYNSEGIAQWGVPMGGTVNPNGFGKGVTVDLNGNVYVTGQFDDQSFNLYNTGNIESGIVLANSNDQGGYTNVFLAKYNSEGIAQWGVPMGGITFSARGNGVTVDLNGTAIYVTGYFNDPAFNLYNTGNIESGIVLANSTGPDGYNNAFLAKYDSQGIAQWGVPMGGTVNPYDIGYDVTVDLNGNVYVTGYFNDQSFNLYNRDNVLSDVVLVNSTGGSGPYNSFLVHYDSQGNALWGRQLGGLVGGGGGYDVAVQRFFSYAPPFNPSIPLTNQSAKQLLYNSFSPFLRR